MATEFVVTVLKTYDFLITAEDECEARVFARLVADGDLSDRLRTTIINGTRKQTVVKNVRLASEAQ